MEMMKKFQEKQVSMARENGPLKERMIGLAVEAEEMGIFGGDKNVTHM